jgi:putative membrane protein
MMGRFIDRQPNLSLERTHLARERTLMAWVRTSTSLITFGFGIYKFFQLEKGGMQYHQLIGPRVFAMFMISIGLLSLVVATIQHLQSGKVLKEQFAEIRRSLAALVAGLISLLGLMAIAAVIFKQ